jgi:hypothetical protein
MRRVVVVIGADPEKSLRAVEGLRMSVGLALAENRVKVYLPGAAAARSGGFPGSDPASRRAGEFLGALRELGAEVRQGEATLAEIRGADAVIRWGE